MGYPLEVLVFGLLSTGLLWEGVQCDTSKYKLYVQPATVQEGLCVFIPCNFTYDPADADNTSTLYGYWTKGGCGFKSFPLVATNDPKETIAENARNRFFLSEKVGQGNCSLVINDAQNNDGGDYCFRMQKALKANFDFKDYQLKVNVEGLQDPATNLSGNLQANHPVSFTYTVPGSCSLKPPNISCKAMARNFTLSASEEQSNGNQVQSVFEFTPSVADNKQNLTCSVTYGTGNTAVYKETIVRLNVTYPPQTPVISFEIKRQNNSSRNESDASQITVDQGDTVVLYCKAVGNPSANITWLNGSNHIIAGNKLVFSSVMAQDAGDYTCLANNSVGSNSKAFQLLLQSSEPVISNPIYAVVGALAVIAVVVLIIAVVLVFKRYQRKSMMDLELHKTLQTLRSIIPPSDQTTNENTYGSAHLPKDKVAEKTVFMLYGGYCTTGFRIPFGHISAYMGRGVNMDPNPIGNDVPKEPEKAEESIDNVANDPDNLHYASLTFVARQEIPDVIPEEPQTEYAEIKR